MNVILSIAPVTRWYTSTSLRCIYRPINRLGGGPSYMPIQRTNCTILHMCTWLYMEHNAFIPSTSFPDAITLYMYTYRPTRKNQEKINAQRNTIVYTGVPKKSERKVGGWQRVCVVLILGLILDVGTLLLRRNPTLAFRCMPRAVNVDLASMPIQFLCEIEGSSSDSPLIY